MNNPHRYPVVFTIRVTQTLATSTSSTLSVMMGCGGKPVLQDPIIVMLTYFRHLRSPFSPEGEMCPDVP